MNQANSTGLDGITVGDTHLSLVDGERGRLCIRGVPIDALSRRPFEDVCALLWNVDASSVQLGLARGRSLAFDALSTLGKALLRPDAMDALRGAIAQLVESERSGTDGGAELTGAVAVFAAAWHRLRQGKAPLAPTPDAAHARDYLSMLGLSPSGVDSLNAYWATVVDHGFNASTFAARTVASTGSDLVSAVVAALGALKGPLHGGAPGPVLDMLDAIGSPEHARAWLSEELRCGRRIMGMGHRVYQVRDPRAAALASVVHAMNADRRARLTLALQVEAEAERLLREHKPQRSLHANVEFFTAVLLETLGIPRELFTATFAASRIAGWCAHVAEQRARGRLIRPRARYVGPTPPLR